MDQDRELSRHVRAQKLELARCEANIRTEHAAAKRDKLSQRIDQAMYHCERVSDLQHERAVLMQSITKLEHDRVLLKETFSASATNKVVSRTSTAYASVGRALDAKRTERALDRITDASEALGEHTHLIKQSLNETQSPPVAADAAEESSHVSAKQIYDTLVPFDTLLPEAPSHPPYGDYPGGMPMRTRR